MLVGCQLGSVSCHRCNFLTLRLQCSSCCSRSLGVVLGVGEKVRPLLSSSVSVGVRQCVLVLLGWWF